MENEANSLKNILHEIDEEYCFTESCSTKAKLLLINTSEDPYFNEEQKEYLMGLCNTSINEQPFLSVYVKNKLVLMKVNIYSDIIHYKFCLEKCEVKEKYGRPVKVITESTCECRHFIEEGVVFISARDNNDMMSIAYAAAILPLIVKLKTVTGYTLNFRPPKVRNLSLNLIQMEVLKSFFHTLVRVSENMTPFVNSTSLELSELYDQVAGVKKKFTVKSSVKYSGKLAEFYYKDLQGKKQKLLIKANGEMEASVPLAVRLLDEAVAVISVLSKHADISEFLLSFEGCLDEYLNFIHSDMEEEVRSRQKREILKEAKEFVYTLMRHSGYKLDNLYITRFTIIINILIRISSSDISKNYIADTGIEMLEYSNFMSFLILYTRRVSKVSIREADIEKAVAYLHDIIVKK